MVRLTDLLRMLAFRPPKKDASSLQWRKRLALTYALSSWFVVGCLAYAHFTSKKDESESPPAPTNDMEDLPDAEEDEDVILEGKEVYSSTMTYRENFVPFSEKISNLFKSSDNNMIDKSPTEE